jgi:uncharacterized membrane protein YphA (DoxX/SURF4 family)
MSNMSRRVRVLALWVVSVAAALAIGSAGLSKLLTTGEWDRLFAFWGYPQWFMLVVGSLEVLGAVALLVRPVAWAGAAMLAAIMLGAAATVIVHPGSHFFRGRQAPLTATAPLVWLGLLSVVGMVRWRQMLAVRQNGAALVAPPRSEREAD